MGIAKNNDPTQKRLPKCGDMFCGVEANGRILCILIQEAASIQQKVKPLSYFNVLLNTMSCFVERF